MASDFKIQIKTPLPPPPPPPLIGDGDGDGGIHGAGRRQGFPLSSFQAGAPGRRGGVRARLHQLLPRPPRPRPLPPPQAARLRGPAPPPPGPRLRARGGPLRRRPPHRPPQEGVRDERRGDPALRGGEGGRGRRPRQARRRRHQAREGGHSLRARPRARHGVLRRPRQGERRPQGAPQGQPRRSEAMFADLGHFNQLSIQIAFTCMVYPSLILAYMGQAAYLSKHHILEGDYRIGFYVSVPGRRSGAGGGQEPILAPTVLLVLMAWSWPPSPRTRALQLLGFNYVDYFLGSCRRVMAATVASVALFYISVF